MFQRPNLRRENVRQEVAGTKGMSGGVCRATVGPCYSYMAYGLCRVAGFHPFPSNHLCVFKNINKTMVDQDTTRSYNDTGQ